MFSDLVHMLHSLRHLRIRQAFRPSVCARFPRRNRSISAVELEFFCTESKVIIVLLSIAIVRVPRHDIAASERFLTAPSLVECRDTCRVLFGAILPIISTVTSA